MPYEVGVGIGPNTHWLDGFAEPQDAVAHALCLAGGHCGPEQFCGGWVL